MYDLIVRSGKVIDGSGAPARTADVAISDGVIVEVGKIAGGAVREIDADGCLVTPGFVDVHTHFDGQVSWDPLLSPSCWHGVTTVVMGNCGVGFAPVEKDRREWLIGLMEGVEDIPALPCPKASAGAGSPSPNISTPSPASHVPWTSEPRYRTAPSGLT